MVDRATRTHGATSDVCRCLVRDDRSQSHPFECGGCLSLPSYEVADLFEWSPTATYDAVFFSFWLSHVPEDRFAPFWLKVAAALRPGGRAYLIDSPPDETSTAHDHRMPDPDGIQERRLNDGRTFRIVKLFREPADLSSSLQALGWRTAFERTPNYFVYGQATPL